MHTLRILLAFFAFLCLAGWLWLHKPYSPADDLPTVTYTAFQVNAPAAEAGRALAKAARGWEGVTASAYNISSGLLVLSHTEFLSEKDLQSRLNILTATPVSKKIFPAPTGSQCPVPAAALASLPQWLLGIGLVLGVTAIALSIGRSRRRLDENLT